jgi:hypothetical protein
VKFDNPLHNCQAQSLTTTTIVGIGDLIKALKDTLLMLKGNSTASIAYLKFYYAPIFIRRLPRWCDKAFRLC